MFRQRLSEIEPFSVPDGFRLFYRWYAARFGKPRGGDKTPLYCRHIRSIVRLLPEARFVHVIRDGRAVAASLRDMWFSPGRDIDTQARYWRENVLLAREQGAACGHYLEVRYEEVVRSPESTLRTVCDFLDLDFRTEMLLYHERAPHRLLEHQGRVRPDGHILVTQMDRIRQQALTMAPPDVRRIDSWRQKLSRKECRRFEALAGDLLQDLGYPE
jgi:hypothetical protein